MGGTDKDDPFAIFHMPPPNETPEERTSRERREAEAQRVSDQIDDKIKAEKAALKKQQKGMVKVLLLGQSESGKSTTLKSEFSIGTLQFSILTHFLRLPHEVRTGSMEARTCLLARRHPAEPYPFHHHNCRDDPIRDGQPQGR
jgi:hypothetical protein